LSTALSTCLAVFVFLFAPANAYAAEASQASAPAAGKLQFPEGAATPSEVCGACHKMIFREMAYGIGTDLNWKGMKVQPKSNALLELPPNVSRSATAHFVAGFDPWPIEAARVEENGKKCNVCHYPQSLAYPDLLSAAIDKPKPRELHQERGVTCASCHLTPEGKIRGSYAVDTPHETEVDERIRTSVACAYCHSAGERIVGKQTQTFLEWREDFNKPGLGRQECQDCHMSRTVRKLAEDFPVPERVVVRHTSTGSHSFARGASALNLAIAQTKEGRSELALHVTNIGAGHSVPTGSNRRAIYLTAELVNARGKVVANKEWMFAPWMLGRPDDKKFVEEDLKGDDPVATSQADAQGPHETIIRAGEDRVLDWSPSVPAGQYTVRATLTYDLNRYNDRAFKGDQYEIGKASLQIKVGRPAEARPSQMGAEEKCLRMADVAALDRLPALP
jgi:hypothetical protein